MIDRREPVAGYDPYWGQAPVRNLQVQKTLGVLVDAKGRWLTRRIGFYAPDPPPQESRR